VFALGALGKMPLTLSYRIGFGLIETAVLLFLVLAGVALGRTRARGEVVHGMRLVLAALLGTLILGTWMELAYGGATAVPNRGLWIRVHASFALLGWVGGLIGVVSWEVLPMFYLARPLRAWQRRLWLGLVYGGLGLAAGVLPLAALSPPLLGLRWMAAAAALPAIVAVGFVQPKWQADALRARLRRRADSSLGYWYVALALAPVTAAVAIVAAVVPDPRVRVLFVWLAVWGWAGVTVHGMLARIMPFLVWLHRYSGLVGRVPVPSIRSLLPDAWVAAALRAHVIALGIGVAAVLARNDALCRLLGASIAITALIVLAGMVRVVRAGVPRYAGAPEAPAVRTG